MKLSTIKKLIETGKAIDITNASPKEIAKIESEHDCDNYMFSGVNGYGPVNGCIFTAYDTGDVYAVAGRSAALFYLYQ